MYDENLINDSLETCRYLSAVKNGLTTRELFENMALLEEKNACHRWEKVLDEINNVSEEEETNYYNIKKKKKVSHQIMRNVITFIVCIVISFYFSAFINTFIAHQTTIEGTSMEPSIKNNDSVIIQKLSYYWRDPKRYDVIVFPVATDDSEENSDVFYIKRVIGLPGEVVQIINGKVYINGNKLKGDTYSEEEIINPGIAEMPVQLDKDEYFVLGDNRNMSTDSRYQYVGMVKRDAIEGEAWCCIWPFSHIKKL